MLRTAPKTHYYTHAARHPIPEWDADLTISPILEDNTTGLFVEYFIASTEITGRICGKEVYGIGLTEHTKIWYENYELVRMIQNTLKNLPDKAFVEDREHTQRKLSNDLEEVLVFAELGDKSRARNLLGADLEIIPKKLREDEIKGPTASPSPICRDLMNRL